MTKRNLDKLLTQTLCQDKGQISSYLCAQTVNQLCQQHSIDKTTLGLALLPLAARFAVTPVSHFNVGAVAFDTAGNAYLGANFEFADVHIAQTIHAEQSAITHAWSRGAKELALLVINYAPCGHCRQFINEVKLSDDFQIILPNQPPQSLAAYLPNAFGPGDLGIDKRILDPNTTTSPNHVNRPHTDNVVLAAQDACKHAHAPYSGSYSGVALQYHDGEISCGYYAENAAFNPSLPPLQMALNVRRLQGKNWRDIARAVMIESPTTLSQRNNTETLLASFSNVVLHYQHLDN